jgi:hypothetical protein
MSRRLLRREVKWLDETIVAMFNVRNRGPHVVGLGLPVAAAAAVA